MLQPAFIQAIFTSGLFLQLAYMTTQQSPVDRPYTAAYKSAVATALGNTRPSKEPVRLSAELTQAIANRFEGEIPQAPVLIAYISAVARASLNEYLVVNQVQRKALVRKQLTTLVDELTTEIAQHEAQGQHASLTVDEANQWAIDQQARQRTLLRYQIELQHKPKAYRDVEALVGEQEVSFDWKGLAKAQKQGLVKHLSSDAQGSSVEFYSALDAQELILQLHGKL